jgi:hypothetical protein
MKWLVALLLFIGFIGYEARGNGNNNADPASSSATLGFHSIEASHEAYRPAETNPPSPSSSAMSSSSSSEAEGEALKNQKNRFSDIFSSISREYHDDDDDDGKSLIDNRPTDTTASLDDESALNALKFSTTTLTLSSSPVVETLVNATNAVDDGQRMMKMVKSGCNSLIRKGKILEYLQLGDKLVKVNARSDSSSGGKFQIDVTHDVFSTTASLLAGIIYKGKESESEGEQNSRVIIIVRHNNVCFHVYTELKHTLASSLFSLLMQATFSIRLIIYERSVLLTFVRALNQHYAPEI